MKSFKQSSFFVRPALAGPRACEGFTLLEVLIAATISLLVLACALPALVSGLSLGMKSASTNLVTNNLRLASEHMVRQISAAESFLLVGSPVNNRFSIVSYLSSAGMPGQLKGDASAHQTDITVSFDGTCHPQVNDYIDIAGLNMGNNQYIITRVQDTRTDPTVRGDVILTVPLGIPQNVSDKQNISIWHWNNYTVQSDPDASGSYQLVWNTQVIARGLTSQYIFSNLASAGINAPKVLAFDFVAQNSHDVPKVAAGSQLPAYTQAGIHGYIIPKSQSPFNVMQYIPPATVSGNTNTVSTSSGQQTVSSAVDDYYATDF